MAWEYTQQRRAQGVTYLAACLEIDARVGVRVRPDDSQQITKKLSSTTSHVLISVHHLIALCGDPGALAFESLRALRRCITFDKYICTFSAKPEPIWRQVYQQAATERWCIEECKIKISAIKGRQYKDQRPSQKQREKTRRNRWADEMGESRSDAPKRDQVQPDLIACSAYASPGDVADMVMKIIEANENPRLVAVKVMPRLSQLVKRKASFVLGVV